MYSRRAKRWQEIISRVSSITDGMVVFLPLTESGGTRYSTVDNTSFAATGVLPAIGRVGSGMKSVSRNASTQLVGDPPDMPTGNVDFTVACNVLIEAAYASTAPTIMTYSDVSGAEWQLIWSGPGQKIRLRVYSAAAAQLASVDAPTVQTVGQWYDIRFGLSTADNKIFIQVGNGTKTLSSALTGTVGARASATLKIGAKEARFDNIAVWDRLLTDVEWTSLYTLWSNGGSTPGSATPVPYIDVYSPESYRVFQRSGSTGTIAITGHLYGLTDDVEASFNGGAYATIASSANGAFSGSLTSQNEGQGTLTVRAKNNTSISTTVAYVGIGDVFIVAGQSNGSGRGTNNQTYSHATLKAGMLSNDYHWRELADPTDSNTNQVDAISDDLALPAGSVWPLVATLHMASQGVPVAFVNVCKGGTSITAWQPSATHDDRNTLYGQLNYRTSLSGCKCVLWWQGETDAVAAMAQATYNTNLDTLANTLNSDLGVKLMPCKLQSNTGITDANENAINAAIADAWTDNVNVLTGPDLTSITTDSGDGLHLNGNTKLSDAATLWWNAIATAFGW